MTKCTNDSKLFGYRNVIGIITAWAASDFTNLSESYNDRIIISSFENGFSADWAARGHHAANKNQ